MKVNYETIIRSAEMKDELCVIEATRALLAELRGVSETSLAETISVTFKKLIDTPSTGKIFVAERGNEMIGFIGLSIQWALHTAGPYALIQELWVHPNYRSARIGSKLLEKAEAYCVANLLSNLEVCLPGKRFRDFEKTYHFYDSAGFSEIGPRMRKGIEQ